MKNSDFEFKEDLLINQFPFNSSKKASSLISPHFFLTRQKSRQAHTALTNRNHFLQMSRKDPSNKNNVFFLQAKKLFWHEKESLLMTSKTIVPTPWAKTIKKNTNSTQNKSQTHRAKQYEVTSFLSTVCELSTETCSKNVYSLGPWTYIHELISKNDSSNNTIILFYDKRNDFLIKRLRKVVLLSRKEES